MSLSKFFFPLFIFFSIILFSFRPREKYFEGYIEYKVNIESFNKDLKSKDLQKDFGSKCTFWFKNGDYKQMYNGKYVEEEYFDHIALKDYSRPAGTDTFMEMDLRQKSDSIIRTDKSKSVKKVLGYNCDELPVHVLMGPGKFSQTTKYYYNTDAAPLDPEWFSKALNQDLNFIYGTTRSIPLEIQVENAAFKITLTAKSIVPKSVADAEIHLPAGALTKPRN